MIYIKYGTAKFATQVWNEIEKGNPVALQIYGWRKRIIHQLMSLYAEYSQGMVQDLCFLKLAGDQYLPHQLWSCVITQDLLE